jgi:N-methylhydantoinase B
VKIRWAAGREPVIAGMTARLTLQKGDVARLITGAGGGWGDPKKRDRDAVRSDLRNGLISEETARNVYGLAD